MRFRSDAAKLVQFEQRGLSGQRGLAGFVLHRKLRRLDDARFEQRCQSCWVALHQHFAQRLKSVGYFAGRRRFLLGGKYTKRQRPYSSHQGDLESLITKLRQLNVAICDCLA